MKRATRARIETLAADCGCIYILLVMIAFWPVAGFLPPPPPLAGASEIAALFASPTGIRIGMVLIMWAALVCVPFTAIIARQITRIEGDSRILTYTALLGGVGLMVLTFYPAIWWLTAAYRLDRSAEAVLLLNDMSWLQFIGGVSMYDALPLSVGIAVLCDDSPDPVFPRWLGYYNLLTVSLILPDQLLFFFHSGPFAWNGLFALWLPLAMFCAWFIVHTVMLRRAIRREHARADSDHAIVNG